jgi:sugar lactone lactonase YvrE
MPLCARTSIRTLISQLASVRPLNSRVPIVAFLSVATMVSGAWKIASAQTKTATSTTIAVTSGGASATTVPAGSVITLTAVVKAGSTTLTTGQVNFCDAAAKYCTDIHLLGTAQLTSAGTAVLRSRPGIGSHSYKALFLGTTSDASSSSSASELSVTGTGGPFASTTTIAETGSWGNYTLTGTVMEVGGTTPLSGSASFLDTAKGNSILATVQLGASVAGISWPNPPGLTTNTFSQTVTVGDFNGDGIPDVAAVAGGTGRPVEIFLGNANGTYTAAPSPAISAYTFRPIVVADLNGDGNQDLALLDGDNNTVVVLLGNGDGTFTEAASSPSTPSSAENLVVADFNGDGIPDLAVTSTSTSSVTVLLGNGDGTFSAASTSPQAGGSPYGIAAGDFNGDGKVDLAVTDQYDDTISILLGNGDGTFTAGTSKHSGSSGSLIAVADFNEDGNADLAVGVIGASGSPDSVTIVLGNGNGTFISPAPGQTVNSGSVAGIAVGDFNADGTPDLAVSDSAADSLTVFLGNGRGSFAATTPILLASLYEPPVFATGDMNGDGRTDLLVGNSLPDTVSIYLTQPRETAIATTSLLVAGVGQHLVDASFGGGGNYQSSVSGTLPLWGVPSATSTTLTVTAGGASVTSVAPGSVVTLTATVKAAASPVTAGQVNFCDAAVDDCTDIHLLGTVSLTSSGTATFMFVPGAGTHTYKAVFAENGYGMSSSSSVVTLTVGPAPSPVYSDTASITDSGLSGDYTLITTVTGYGGPAAPTGKVSFLDTSFANNNLGTASLGTGTAGLGWLISQTPAVGGTPIAEVGGDFNGDGIPDVAVLWSNNNPFGPFSVTVFFGKGNGTFNAGPTTQVTGVQEFPSMIAADLNGDGKTDLALLSTPLGYTATYVTVMLGYGDGTFAAPQTTQAYKEPQTGGDFIQGSMVAADFNGDGKMDLAVVGDYISSGGVTVLLGNGDGTFNAVATNFAPDQGFNDVATGDFNGDGIPDLVATNYFGPGGATVLLGKGDGTFALGVQLTVGTFVSSIVTGDFNGDGIADLAFGYNIGGVGVYLGKGDGTFNQAPSIPIQGAGLSLVAGDFNHDGRLDLAGIDNYNLQIDLFLGAGDGTFTETVTTPNISQNFLGPFQIVAADFNEDGVPDLAMLDKDATTAAILLTEPTQTATASVSGIAPVGAGTHNVEASYAGDSNYPSSISTTVALTAGMAPVVISPASGTYSSVLTVTMSESVPGATIYYAAYGPISTNGFVQYKGPITLNLGGAETIQAYASETGYQSSNYTTANYRLNLPVAPTPVISPAGGSFASAQTVSITDARAGATIYYTTDGTYPTLASTIYTGPITVSTSETVAAIASAGGYSTSNPASAQYIIDSSTSSFIYTVAGNSTAGYSGDGGQATFADLNSPATSVLDKSGNLYIADSNNNVVRKVAAGTGIITTIAGTGVAGFSGDGGPATSAQLNYPYGLALDSSGNLYISDLSNSRIRKITAATGIITTIAGNGTFGRSGDGGPATSAELSYPYGITIDGSGNLFIADADNDELREVVAATGSITTVAGNGSYGYSGDGGRATSASFRLPEGVAVDASGNLYIADSWNNVIRKVTASTGIISTLAGNGFGAGSSGGYSGDGGPAASAELSYPTGVALDGAGNLYIADFYNQAIRKVAASNGYISTVAGNGPQNPCNSLGGDGGPSTSAALCYPSSVSVDGAGNLYIAGNDSRIRMTTVTAAPPTASTAAPSFSVSSGTYAGAQVVTLSDATPGAAIYVTLDGSLPSTISQLYNGPINVTGTITIKAVAAAPGFLPSAPVTATYNVSSTPVAGITTVAGNGGTSLAGAGGPATSAQVGYPDGIALDNAGDFYFSDTANNVVWMVSAKTGIASVVAGDGIAGSTGNGGPATNAELWSPKGIAVDSAGNIYIADSSNNVVRKVAEATGLITIFAGNGQAGNPDGLGDGGLATSAQLSNPFSLAFDKVGNLYIADTYDNRVRMVSASTGIITTVAGNGNFGPLGDGGAATSAAVEEPDALAFDLAGNLYVATPQVGRIRKVATGTGIITTIAGNGVEGSSGDGGPATSAEIAPNGLAVDAAGNVYFSDYPNAVRVVVASTGKIMRVVGNGYYGYSGDGGSATVAGLADPVGIAFDSAGNLFIADNGSSRIRKVTFSAAAATPVFSVSSGTYSSSQTVKVTDTTPGAAIYYTTDGTTPTTTSSLYTAPIVVSATETIKAIAVADGYVDSAVASAKYTIDLTPAATPVFSPTAGTYTTAQTVTITDATAGTTIYYTTNGTTPSTSSSGYSGPISVSQTETLEAIAVATGYSQSAVATATYTIHPLLTPSMTITPSSSHITTAQELTVTISVNGGNGKPTPTGNIALKIGSYSAQKALTSGSVSFVLPAGTLPAGTDTLTATYAPDSSSADTYSSTTQTATLTVTAPGAAVAAISITPAAQSITNEQSANVSISVSGGSGQPTPTGSVTLSNASYTAVQSLTGGTASFTIPAGTLNAGANTLTVGYSGDTTYGSASGTTVLTVSSVVITVQTPPAVSPGSNATANVTLSAGSNYSGTMTLTCKLTSSPSGAQSLPGCSLNPASVTITSGQSGASTLMIQTTGNSGSALLERTIRWLGGGASALATVLLLGIPAKRRRWIALFALLMIGTAGAIGCGGGGSNQTTTSSGPPSTTAGSYTFTVTGTDASANVSTSTTVTVTIQ